MGVSRYGISLRVEEGDIGLKARREVLFLQATVFYFICYINIIVFSDNKSRLY